MKPPISGRPIEILMVEDNPGDVDLTREGLINGKLHNNLNVVEDGEEAMAYLRRQGKHAAAARPDVILLDLDLPRKSGREVLADIKSDNDLRDIPVVILTSSDDERDVFESYRLRANCYITKPVKFEQFIKVVKSFKEFWFTIVTLPPERTP